MPSIDSVAEKGRDHWSTQKKRGSSVPDNKINTIFGVNAKSWVAFAHFTKGKVDVFYYDKFFFLCWELNQGF